LGVLRQWERGADAFCVLAANTLTERLCMDLAGFDAGLRPEGVVWSPDSRRIAFDEDIARTMRDGDLWVLDVATGEATHLTDDGYRGALPTAETNSGTDVYLDTNPAWSPDGTALVFARTVWQRDAAPTPIVRVGIADGRETTLLSLGDRDGAMFVKPLWSSDGRRIVYSEVLPDEGDRRNGVWEFGVDGQGWRQITGADPASGPPVLAELSAGGDLALVHYPQPLDRWDGSPWAILDLATGAVTPLGTLAGGEATAAASDVTATVGASFSPDGRSILIVSWVGDVGALLVEAVGGEVTPLLGGIPAAEPVRPAGGNTWATNGTIFVPTGDGDGLLVELAGVAPATPVARRAAEDGSFALVAIRV
jgi:dipeptidyl aminopeptidase/acylaminoacyl peptidase